MPVLVQAVDHPAVAPHPMSDRFRHDITYFATPPGSQGAPDSLPEREYWVRREDAQQAFDDGVIRLVSPLDSAATAEIEISEEHEDWLDWMLKNGIQHIRLTVQ